MPKLRFLLWTESSLYVPTRKLFFISCDIQAYLLPLKLLFTYFVKLSTLRSYFINQQRFFNQMVYVPFFSVTSKHLKIACGVCLILQKCFVTLDKWGLSFFHKKRLMSWGIHKYFITILNICNFEIDHPLSKLYLPQTIFVIIFLSIWRVTLVKVIYKDTLFF